MNSEATIGIIVAFAAAFGLFSKLFPLAQLALLVFADAVHRSVLNVEILLAGSQRAEDRHGVAAARSLTSGSVTVPVCFVRVFDGRSCWLSPFFFNFCPCPGCFCSSIGLVAFDILSTSDSDLLRQKLYVEALCLRIYARRNT